MLNLALQYPVFGSEIQCPHCQQSIPALTLTDSYLCQYHGAFEADPSTQDLVHLTSGRQWKQWEGRWYRQHTHPDGLRFEIYESLDRFYSSGSRVKEIVVADRYRLLLTRYFQRTLGRSPQIPPSAKASSPAKHFQLYGLPVAFSDPHTSEPRWSVINFDLEVI